VNVGVECCCSEKGMMPWIRKDGVWDVMTSMEQRIGEMATMKTYYLLWIVAGFVDETMSVAVEQELLDQCDGKMIGGKTSKHSDMYSGGVAC